MAEGLGGILGNMFGMGQPQAQQPGSLGNPMQGMGLLGRLQYLQQNNPEALMVLGSGMMQGNMAGGFAAAGDQMSQHRERAAEQQKVAHSQNLTKRWLMSNKGMDDQQAEMAMSNPAILSQVLKTGKGGDGSEFGLSPVYGTDADGNQVLGQLSKDGKFQQTELPGGFKLTPGVDRIDLGTAWGITNRAGEVISTIPKQTYQESFEKGRGAEEGKAAGTVAGEYESIASKMPGLEAVVSELDQLSEQATYTAGGQLLDTAMRQAGMEPREAAVARARYIAMVDNQVLPLLRDTFGAAFTQKEGETLRQTLGDPDKSPAEKQEVLKAFIEQKRRDVEALRSRSGGTIPAPAQGGGTRLRFNPATGELE